MTSEAEIRVLLRTFQLPKIESARDKVRTVDELTAIAHHLRDIGRSVVRRDPDKLLLYHHSGWSPTIALFRCFFRC